MACYWLLTWTTYGTWLPGDPRGFVGRVREGAQPAGPRVEHDRPGTPYLKDLLGLERASRARMKGEPVWLNQEQANVAAQDFIATARFRGWSLLAGAVLANHVHLVTGTDDDVAPARLLQLFKSYASRALSQRFGRPAGGTWWTESGSRRKLPDDRAVQSAVRYVQNQRHPLVIWVSASLSPASGVSNDPDE